MIALCVAVAYVALLIVAAALCATARDRDWHRDGPPVQAPPSHVRATRGNR